MQKEAHQNPLTPPHGFTSIEKNHRILIVDDDPSIRSMLEMILREGKSYEILTAENGRKALDVIKNHKQIDVVLTDIQMPRMNGMELLKEIKSIDPTLPVIMITGFPTIDIAIRCMKEGASDFITKPFKFDQVELILSRTIHERELLLENAKLKEELARSKEVEILNHRLAEKIKELTILYSISESMSSIFNSIDQVLEKTLEVVAGSLDCERISILFLDRPTKTLYIRAAKGLDSKIVKDTIIPVGDGISGKVFELRAPLLVKDINKDLDKDLRSNWFYKSRSLISAPLFFQGEPFGVINATDRIGDIPFTKDDLVVLETIAKKVSLNIENVVLYECIYDNLIKTLMTLVRTLEARDPYTQKHSERVTFYSLETAKKLGCSEDMIETLGFAGYLHDIGKIGVTDTVLLKKGKLTDSEFEMIKRHPVIGEQIVQYLELLPEERAIIRSHHERWDGKGYPDGLKGEEIPYPARILMVSDTYDAMTSSRPYRKAMQHEEAMDELFRYKWSQFDGNVVDAFSSIIGDAKKRVEKMKGSVFSLLSFSSASHKKTLTLREGFNFLVELKRFELKPTLKRGDISKEVSTFWWS